MKVPTVTSAGVTLPDGPLVVRSSVPVGLAYNEYRPYLRYDFIHTCAYCTISETEAGGVRFTIDHYEPQGTVGTDVHAYANLMYCCDECNLRKGNRSPPPAARQAGIRFYRPDVDRFDDHFKVNGLRIDTKSDIGYYTKEALDLNRQGLRRLRDARKRLDDCHEMVSQGLLGLRRVHIDRLPKHLKARTAGAIAKAYTVAGEMADAVDELLRQNARSPLLDDDPEADARYAERRKSLSRLEDLYPGEWRKPRTVKS